MTITEEDDFEPKPSLTSPVVVVDNNNNNKDDDDDELLQRKGLSPREKAKLGKKYSRPSADPDYHTYIDELESTVLAVGEWCYRRILRENLSAKNF